MKNDFTTAPLAPGLRGAGGSAVEKSLSASHTEILTLPREASESPHAYASNSLRICVKALVRIRIALKRVPTHVKCRA